MSLAMSHKTPGFSVAHMKYCCKVYMVMCGSLQRKVCSSIGGTVSLFTMQTEAAGGGEHKGHDSQHVMISGLSPSLKP